VVELYLDLRGTCVYAVLDELFYEVGGPLNDLTSGNLIDHFG
jgi:hypothetical protein